MDIHLIKTLHVNGGQTWVYTKYGDRTHCVCGYTWQNMFSVEYGQHLSVFPGKCNRDRTLDLKKWGRSGLRLKF